MKKFLVASLFIGLFLASVLPVAAQRQTGSLTGKITDKERLPLPGAFVYVSSPALLGIRTYITSDTGLFRFPELPPGMYKITVEMPGFKTNNLDEITLPVGKTLTVNVTMETTTVEEEVTSHKTSPMLDVASPKASSIVDQNLLLHIPLARDLGDIIATTPGAISESLTDRARFAFNGSSSRANQIAMDGFDVTDPFTLAPISNIDFNIIEQVEFGTAAQPAGVGPMEGGYINVITKSGGNAFGGALTLYHGSKSLSKTLWTDQELAGLSLVAPPEPNNLWDASLTLGGPFLEDRAWFFTDFRFNHYSHPAPFLSYVDPLGTNHPTYDWRKKELLGFFKLTSQVISNLRFSAEVNIVDHGEPVFESSLSPFTPEESTLHLNNEFNLSAIGNGTYALDQNTFVDFRGGLDSLSSPLLLNDAAQNKPQYYDAATGRNWGSAAFNLKNSRKRFLISGSITRYQDTRLAGNHELKLGGEYEDVSQEESSWKPDNLLLNYFNGSPYFYGTGVSPKTGHTVGKGKIAFYTTGATEGGLIMKHENVRLSAFVQDTISFGQRVSLQLGLRFDHSTATLASVNKADSGNAISVTLGDTLVKPLAGINPYSAVVVPEWSNAITWNVLSPRVGLSIDLSGKGRTLLKASYGRSSEYLNLLYPFVLSSFTSVRSHQFDWYDENGDGKVDSNDSFGLIPQDFRIYNVDFLKKRLDPELTPPTTTEFTIGLEQELLKDFSLSFRYITKNKKNIISNVLYSPDLNKDWYTLTLAEPGWWVPFTTTVPADSSYPATPVTVYFRSNSAPANFERMKNVPELKRKYQALEFVLNKRLSNNWQFYGSVVFSKATGNIGLDNLANSVFSGAGLNPNSFVNIQDDARLDLDRPLALKFMGTYKFPFGFYFSLYFVHMAGVPWARSVTIVPPESWLLANNAVSDQVQVFLEKPGTRKYDAYENLDLRIEKEFKLGKSGRLRGFVDVLNVLGQKYSILDENDGGIWFPDAADSALGVRILSPSFKKYTSLLGTRAFKLNLSLYF